MARGGQPMLQAVGGFVLTKSDSADIIDDAGNTQNYTDIAYTVYVGGGGDLNVVTINGDTILFSGVAGGTFLPVQIKRVLSTDTSATLMVALKAA
jgi:hypothetical protein